jgi:hypothetical protein
MMDTELEAMQKVHGALEDLDTPARERVLRWAADRFGIGQTLPAPPAEAQPATTSPVASASPSDLPQFRDIGDFVHAAG